MNQEVDQNFDPTTTWQTYRNEEYGFEVKYPPSWKVVSDKSAMTNGVEGFFLTGESWDETISILPYGEFDHGVANNPPIISEIILSGYQASQKQWDNMKLITILDPPKSWSKQNNRIEVNNIDKDDFGIANQILSTFKFIE